MILRLTCLGTCTFLQLLLIIAKHRFAVPEILLVIYGETLQHSLATHDA
jgi:hypothetical protein